MLEAKAGIDVADVVQVEVENMASFSYELPERSIRNFPLENRQDAKLLVSTGGKSDSSEIRNLQFKDLVVDSHDSVAKGGLRPLLSEDDREKRIHLVFNQSKVYRARLFVEIASDVEDAAREEEKKNGANFERRAGEV
jgi:S-adenosylmethionine:tRNA-ribosyltransferase-isomerase (queuine synthetase)